GNRSRVAPEGLRVLRSELEHGRVVPAPAEDADGATVVSCGSTAGGGRIVIVEPAALTPCPPQRVGEIWVSSPSVAHGYWGNPRDSEAVFHARLGDTGAGPFLRTGDLGFIEGDELYVT